MAKSLYEDRSQQASLGTPKLLLWITATLLLSAMVTFLLVTPSGFLHKVDMVGYAVCHQIESHSFSVGGRHLPLCARCTGTFLGAMVCLFGQAVVLRRGRASAFPPVGILAVLIGFTALWAADGLNSYLALVGGPHAYEPANQLRLITGSLNGLTMGALIYPVFNVSLWRDPSGRPGIRGARDLGSLLLLEAALIGLILARPGLLLYPLALLSAGAVLTLLTSVNTVLAVMALRRENSAAAWTEVFLPVALGLLLTFVQVAAIDLLRYAATGTLDGIPIVQ